MSQVRHKRSDTFVAVDEAGSKLGQPTVQADAAGYDKAVRWAQTEYSAEGVRWAIEDCRHLSARLELDLLDAGQAVVRVPPKMMAEQRRVGRARGKSDPIEKCGTRATRVWSRAICSSPSRSRQVTTGVCRFGEQGFLRD